MSKAPAARHAAASLSCRWISNECLPICFTRKLCRYQSGKAAGTRPAAGSGSADRKKPKKMPQIQLAALSSRFMS
jgi:hypothetical protein